MDYNLFQFGKDTLTVFTRVKDAAVSDKLYDGTFPIHLPHQRLEALELSSERIL